MPDQYNAARFAQKPLPQPIYRFQSVPHPCKDLKGSMLQRVDQRDDLQTCMAEMLLLCKEAMRRKKQRDESVSASKPLSLEYLADRLDVDDPCWGYLVRSEEGMLQGFVTITTFTNYQRSFQWDSLHPMAFSFDDCEAEQERLLGVRVWDKNNTLAQELQATVRCGDIWNEGVVWPRIAEISLLGALGCGKTLLSLVLEQLECMKPSATCNYDYVMLQATDNSISFYESLGFVRVGAVMKGEKEARRRSLDSSGGSTDTAEAFADESPEKPNAIAIPYEIVTSKLTSYTTKKPGEQPSEIAKQLGVDVWDVVFLNKDIYAEIAPGSRLLAGTVLHIPAKVKLNNKAARKQSTPVIPQWHVAKENETPRLIAKLYNINCLELIAANGVRLPGLVSSSRLREGTRVKVSHLDVKEDDFKPYAHWTSPDDEVEEGEPSYVMVRRLNRKRGNAARLRPVEESLAIPLSTYSPTPLLLSPSPAKAPPSHSTGPLQSAVKRKYDTRQPQPPTPPLGAYMIFVNQQRDLLRSELQGLSTAKVSRLLGGKWKQLAPSKKARYERIAQEAKEAYTAEKESYNRGYVSVLQGLPVEEDAVATFARHVDSTDVKHTLYNKVVRLKPGAMAEISDYTYWYVLTFIPDLKWCHLAPLHRVGTFGADKPRAKGYPKWMLVDERLGQEVDISSSFCIPIKARTVRRTLDADREEWDIIDDGSNPLERRPSLTPRVLARAHDDSDESYSLDAPPRHKLNGGVKTNTTRKRNRVEKGMDSALIPAAYPRSKVVLNVRLTIGGVDMAGNTVKPKRGRPKGSKDKIKRKAPSYSSPGGRSTKSRISILLPSSPLGRRAAASFKAKGAKSSMKKHFAFNAGKKRPVAAEAPSPSVLIRAGTRTSPRRPVPSTLQMKTNAATSSSTRQLSAIGSRTSLRSPRSAAPIKFSVDAPDTAKKGRTRRRNLVPSEPTPVTLRGRHRVRRPSPRPSPVLDTSFTHQATDETSENRPLMGRRTSRYPSDVPARIEPDTKRRLLRESPLKNASTSRSRRLATKKPVYIPEVMSASNGRPKRKIAKLQLANDLIVNSPRKSRRLNP